MSAANTKIVVRTESLTKYFGDFCAVDAVTFDLPAGEVMGYLGPNGSGKTTTIRMLMGLLLPSAGRAQVLGFDIERASEAIRRRVGYMSQKFALYDELTAWENLVFYAGVYGVRERSNLDAALDRLGLRDVLAERAGELPVGWRQRLALATAIVHRPQLLFLDEPTSGVDPTARRDFWDLIYEFVSEGVTAFVTTHYMDEAEYCNRVGIMSSGKLLAMDTPSALKRNYLPGIAWDVWAEPLLPALSALSSQPGVLRAGLASAHLRVITREDVQNRILSGMLQTAGITGAKIVKAEPSLEDVFLALAGA
ncbi:MAG TPA: ABC transporter ATP-binding protein [Anaerolineales bacterium]|nr:ABC transporter ATP-binding protein [Anaerolineales bacterium]